MGFEPTDNGFANRRPENVKSCSDNTLQDTPRPDTPENTLVKINSPELQLVIDRWESLPDHVREAVLSLVELAELKSN